MKNRGGLGVTCHKLSEKTGRLCGIATVDDEDDLMMITNSGMIIRTPAKDVSLVSRTASGVIVMRLGEDQQVVNFTKVAREEEIEEVFEESDTHTEAIEVETQVIEAEEVTE